jgi:hypothetical protein
VLAHLTIEMEMQMGLGQDGQVAHAARQFRTRPASLRGRNCS